MGRTQRGKTQRCCRFKPDLLPKIVVKDPVTHDTWEHGKYTTYLICIKTVHPAFHLQLSAVRRRYSELRWLHDVLKKQYPYAHFPSPPPKKMLAVRFQNDFIVKRMKDIEIFLNQMLVIETALSDTAFHLFLQTDLTTSEIDEYLDGTLPESFVEKAWENAGHLHTSGYVVRMQSMSQEPQEIVMNEEDRQYSGQSTPSSVESASLMGEESSPASKQASPANQNSENSSDVASQNGATGSSLHLANQNGLCNANLNLASQSETSPPVVNVIATGNPRYPMVVTDNTLHSHQLIKGPVELKAMSGAE